MISETKKQIVIDNYFKDECDINTTIKEAYTKGFNRGVSKTQPKQAVWKRHNTYHGDDISGFVDPDWRCSKCGEPALINPWGLYDLTPFCPNCGANMRGINNEID